MPDIILTDFYEFETWTTEFFVQSFNLYRILDITKKKKATKKPQLIISVALKVWSLGYHHLGMCDGLKFLKPRPELLN